MKKYLFWVLFTIGIVFPAIGQQLTEEEQKLYDLIMKYRKEKGLPPIPRSPSLTFVAQTHAKDLALNRPDQGKCNAHSWSDQGNWIPVCYTSDHKQAEKMWSKPSELTDYKGKGYEIVTMVYGRPTPVYMNAPMALKSWKGSSSHNAVLINSGIWKSSNWQAIGIGIYKGYACVWFGEVSDEINEKNENSEAKQ